MECLSDDIDCEVVLLHTLLNNFFGGIYDAGSFYQKEFRQATSLEASKLQVKKTKRQPESIYTVLRLNVPRRKNRSHS